MGCAHDGCDKPIDRDGVCFLHRVKGVGFSFRGGAVIGRNGWNMTKSEFLRENLGAESEKQLAKRADIEKVG
jgi:hypothetical protein